MMKRKIVEIDQAKCNGCGLCIGACHESAIEMVDGKARLVDDIYCDGLGDCLGECPTGAITITEREADPYDDDAVQQRQKEQLNNQTVNPAPSASPTPKPAGGGCPGMRMLNFSDQPIIPDSPSSSSTDAPPSRLRQWPIQLALVPVNAPYWQDAEILVAADCVAHALHDFSDRLLQGRRLVVACPKLDQRNEDYIEKLTAILNTNDVRGVTVAYMEVPCCHGMRRIAEQAAENSNKALTVRTVKIGIQGNLLEDQTVDG